MLAEDEYLFAAVIVLIEAKMRGETTEMEDTLNEELLLLIKEKFNCMIYIL